MNQQLIQQKAMESQDRIRTIVVVGGGPVGNFAALLSTMYGISTHVYEKRPDYTREINVKIEEDFFKEAGELFAKLSRRNDSFFNELNEYLREKKFKIKLHVLEKKLKEKAESMGALYHQQEIASFEEVYALHRKDFPLVLDCAGRRSPIRIHSFGTDEENMEICDLQSAMNINFKAKLNNMGYLALFQLIYPVFKCNPFIKVGEIVISKNVDESGYSHVTLPLAIEKDLAAEFDTHFPDINRKPWKPFSLDEYASQVPQSLEMAVSSVFYPLVLEDWDIQWDSVVVKKIQITCGYSRQRSRGRLVCLGDSAAHFAYFKSLNIGLQHTAKFFEILLNFPHIQHSLPPFQAQQILKDLRVKYPFHFWHSVYESKIPNEVFAITKPLLYGSFLINLPTMEKTLISFVPNIHLQGAQAALTDHQELRMSNLSWNHCLAMFQSWREKQIKEMVTSNTSTNKKINFLSSLIWINSISPFKISETFMYVRKGYFLSAGDFTKFHTTLIDMKALLKDKISFLKHLNMKLKEIQQYYDKEEIPENLSQFIKEIAYLTSQDYVRWEDVARSFRNLNWKKSQAEYKLASSTIKSLEIMLGIQNQNTRQKRRQRRSLSKQVHQPSPPKVKKVKR